MSKYLEVELSLLFQVSTKCKTTTSEMLFILLDTGCMKCSAVVAPASFNPTECFAGFSS